MKNLLLGIRLFFLKITGYFKKQRGLYPINYPIKNYEEKLYVQPNELIKWQPCEKWGCVKDGNNPYIIWKDEQRSLCYGDLKLTTDLNTVNDEPKIKSGQVCSWDRFYRSFGRYRSMIKVAPKGIQNWFSFWLIGNECTWEIDIFEMMDEDSKGFSCTLHKYVDGVKKIEFSKHFRFCTDLSNDYHLYELDWQSDCISWYFDGIKLCEYKGKYVPNVPMGIIINNAVCGGFKPDGIPQEKLNELFPSYGAVKWVQVLDKNK